MIRTAETLRSEIDASRWNWDTINLVELGKLPRWECPPHLHISDHAGMGCSGDPPGYPTYFLRAVYTSKGNNPELGPNRVIVHPALGTRVVPDVWRAASTWEQAYAENSRLMLSLWRRLPLEHRRTRGWLRQTFVHFRHCYHQPENQLVLGRWAGPEWSDTLLMWPGGTFGHTPFGTIKNVQFEVELARQFHKYDELALSAQAKFVADIEAENAKVTKLCTEVATVDNMDAVSGVRRWYPEFTPEPWLLAEDLRHGGEWWTRRAHPPKPGNCPGFSLDSQHPANTTWCQTCGWYADGGIAEEDVYGAEDL